MIHLHYANWLENLMGPLTASIAQQQHLNPLDRVTVVVPNRVVEQFLKHRVAEAIGVAANLQFPFLRRFLAEVLLSIDPKIRILDLEELELVLFERLRAAIRNPSPDFDAPRHYVELAQGTQDDRDFRTLRLARQLAWLFREYSIARRPMLQKWMRAEEREPLSPTEKWQKHLWISTFDANGYLRQEWNDNPEHEWVLLSHAFDAVPKSKLKTSLPELVHVFGIAYAGPAYIRILSQIGNSVDLHLYTLNPCREFWEDVEQASRAERESWARRSIKIGADLDQSVDPFNLCAADDTPALRLWARPGREYIRMLNELTECDFDAHFTPADSRPASLLRELQEDILNRRPEWKPGEHDSMPDDGSLRFLACPGVAREAEIVASEIWAMLEHDTLARDPMRFHQIGVMVPDALYADYLPHIESAFARLHQLPMNVVNRGTAGESPVREAISMLLRLPLGRFTRYEVLHLMQHPAVAGTDQPWDSEQATRWCEELGIYFGADADDLANTYIPRDTFHWDQGLRRLALGAFMAAEPDQDPRFYAAPDAIEYLPCAITQDEIPAAASFIKKVRQLLFDAGQLRSHRMALAQWSARLSNLILTHIEVEDAAGERVRERYVEAIESIARLELKSEPVSYRIAYEIVAARISQLESQLAQFSENGIVIGPLSALRSIPFRAIFLLGLNENQFPERDRRDPMDLRSTRKAGDVTPTERDRYLFLETLLAARERIRFSYLARDAKTGDRLEPSSIVRELQFILRRYLDSKSVDEMTIEHPLSRYDNSYFADIQSPKPILSRNLTSYDAEAHRGAAMAALRADLARHCGAVALPGRDDPIYLRLPQNTRDAMTTVLRMVPVPARPAPKAGTLGVISLPISALRKFLECPLQGAAQYALGIFEDDGDEIDPTQDEPIAQTILDRTMLLREVFWKSRGDHKLLELEYDKALRLSQLAGEAPAGPFAQAAQRTDRETMAHWIEQARSAGCASLEQWREVRMGRGDEFAKADRVVPELEIPLRGEIAQGSRVVRIQGSLGFISPAGNASLRLVLRDKPKVKDFLWSFLAAMVLAAAGEMSGQHFHSIVVGAGKNHPWNEIRSLRCPSTEQARNYLSDLVSDLLLEKNHYFLPIEAVENVSKEMVRGSGGDLVDIVNEARDNEFAKCSSDYGPIRDARRFDPPGLQQLKKIMARRFGSIASIFVREK